MGSNWNWMFYWSRQGLYELEGPSGSVGSMSDCDSSNDFLFPLPRGGQHEGPGSWEMMFRRENEAKLSICMATWWGLKRRRCGEGTAGGGRWWQQQLQRGRQKMEGICFYCHCSSSTRMIMFWLGYFTVLFDFTESATCWIFNRRNARPFI